MQRCWDIVNAALHCRYKAWTLARIEPAMDLQSFIQSIPIITPNNPVQLPVSKIEPAAKIVLGTLYHLQNGDTAKPSVQLQIAYDEEGSDIQEAKLRIASNSRQIQNLATGLRDVLSYNQPPAFYRNAHCRECQFQEACYTKLKERDCISLLSGMSPKVIIKFQKRGIYSIAQLAHLFRPRRRRSHPQASTNYLWELKAKAITEQKTFVLSSPEIPETPISIFIDFEGLPDEGWIYLVGVRIVQAGQEDLCISYWADSKEQERDVFSALFNLLHTYTDAPVYHYGSYETKALKLAVKRSSALFKREWALLEKRMVNLLGFLRTHVYPPIYSNGLKELARFLGFQWSIADADGLLSLVWRKQWEETRDGDIKAKLLQYNQDDCKALEVMLHWLHRLAMNADKEQVQQVADMKRQSLYKFQNNPELGSDFEFISKAAYFDYQRTKIYWRNKNALSVIPTDAKPKSAKKGVMLWQPKQVNEVVLLPPLTRCPACGTEQIYYYKKKTILRQTDLKFTAMGIKQYVVEYRSTRAKCGKCHLQFNSQDLRKPHYGDNIFAFATNLYVCYNLSNYMISKVIQEHFGIWVNPMYMVMHKGKWWRKWQPEVDYVWKMVRHSPVIHIDETSIQLSKRNGYVWIFATTHSVFYHYSPTREGTFLQEWLKDYKGVIVTDFFAAYDSLPVKRQKCLIHLIRDLNDDLFRNPFDEEYKTIVVAFNLLLRSIIETIDRYGLVQKRLQKHLKDIEQFKLQHVDTVYKGELAVKCTKRFSRHWEQLWTFMHEDGVPWNNNNAEAAVKAFAQYRRGVKGMVGEDGLSAYLNMLSLAQTCRYRSIRFLDFLRRKAGIWEHVYEDVLPGYLPFSQARLYVRRLKFQRRAEWLVWARSGKRPAFIPLSPDRVYKDSGWVDWYDWVGFSFLPFDKARSYMRSLGLKNIKDYREWLKSGKRPRTIPHEPQNIYKLTGWAGFGDWLGTGNEKRQKRKWLPYKQAKAFIQALGITSWQQYMSWSAGSDRPQTIPAAPHIAYHEFRSWGDFLGTERVANQHKEFWTYEHSKAFLSNMGIRSMQHFRELCKAGAIPGDVPKDPKVHYGRQGKWVGSYDFLSKIRKGGSNLISH